MNKDKGEKDKKIVKEFCKKGNPEYGKRKCQDCGSKNMYYDSQAGPIVGGLIVYKAGKDGTVRPSQGAHPTGAWVCLDCQLKDTKKLPAIVSLFQSLKRIEDKVAKIKDIKELLKCPKCGKPFEQIDKHTYKFSCDCKGNDKIRIAVG